MQTSTGRKLRAEGMSQNEARHPAVQAETEKYTEQETCSNTYLVEFEISGGGLYLERNGSAS